ncbi:winged helix-turn-helix domain-containing protein [Xanthomonas sp. NCPPB 2654]|uniref:winged helix-turn-helix domain-containing protein n=1 Tax=unclassified Xanthomonas TaxID=2643310 RepID=UPI0021E042F8|nr:MULTISPECIES: winged helix-turn-helix domain-containing protein [unclassified Xanthomonas]MDL5365904.1 winged helix-turn-helix domain-containing protein [Xanthomonas sp. NCPPB 2654]UYC20530.1 winged helix-turn-helix domain-containing protein [Xanthomonas sp. CFBP 8443]
MGERYRLDDLRIDVARQRVERDGIALELGGLSFRLLHYLLRQGQRVIGFDELIAQVWAPALVNEETVTQRVRLLRQALGDASRQPRYLRSVRGQGYQLCAPVRLEDDEGDSAAAQPRRRWRRVAIAAAVVLGIGTLAALAWPWRTPPQKAEASPLLQRADYYAGIGQRDDNERAIALYRQRLQQAPDEPRALLGLSRGYSARVCQYGGDAQYAALAQRLAAQVIAAQPQLAAAHAALGYAHDCRGDYAAALAAYERALQLDPGADAVRGSAAYLYERKGRLAQALAANLQVRDPARVRFLPIQIASNLNLLGYVSAAEARYRDSFQLYPDSAFSNLAWPGFLFAHGRSAEAQAALDEALGRGTDYAGLYLLQAELALAQGDAARARQASLQALRLRPHGSLAQTVAWTLDAQPRPAAAALRARAQDLLQGVAHGADPLDGLDAALLLQLAGDLPAALDALRRAQAAGYRDAAYLRVSPLLAPLRTQAGFAALLVRNQADIAAERAQVRRAGLLPQETGAATAAP